MFSAFQSESDDRAYKSKAQVKITKYVKSYVQVKSIGVLQWRWPVKSSGVFAFSWRFRYFLSVMPESTSKKKIIAKTKPISYNCIDDRFYASANRHMPSGSHLLTQTSRLTGTL